MTLNRPRPLNNEETWSIYNVQTDDGHVIATAGEPVPISASTASLVDALFAREEYTPVPAMGEQVDALDNAIPHVGPVFRMLWTPGSTIQRGVIPR